MNHYETTITRLERLWNRIANDAANIASRIREAADATQGDEARFRMLFAQIIEPWANALDIPLLIKEERTLATGRADATYNRMVIEYEAPGRLRDNLEHRPTAHAVQQAKDYVEGVAQQERQQVHRLIGVVIDGRYFIYVRKIENHWADPEIEPVNEQSVARFLRMLVSLTSGKALLPDNLVQDFGSNTICAQRVASALYQSLSAALDDNQTGIVDKLFEQWSTFFGQVTGYEDGSHPLNNKPELKSFARGMGITPRTVDLRRLFFAVHTYFALLIKLIAYYVLSRFVSGFGTRFGSMYQLNDDDLRQAMEELERGGIFRTLGIRNFLEGDFFKWYLCAWGPAVAKAIRTLLERLKDYDPETLEVSPEQARDLLKKLYHRLMPREIRHDLGEYYTPDWLAEHVLNELGYYGHPDKRLLDPACGSGTFLVLAIKRLKERCFREGMSQQQTLETILNNIVGIDLNPLAVVAARTNYLLALGDLLAHRTREIDIPVYLADSILMPAAGEELFNQDRYELNTAVGRFDIPRCIKTRDHIDTICNLLEECITNGVSVDEFLEQARRSLRISCGEWEDGLGRGASAQTILSELYRKLERLHAEGLDGIWARILQNAFMPLFLGRFDIVAGNPPWIFWNNLPPIYRDKVRLLMGKRYGLISLTASTMKRLGQAGKDISALFVYVGVDFFLREHGRLGYVVTQSLFQSTASNEFRAFRVPNGPSFAVRRVDDMVEIAPFKTATNRTACLFLERDERTIYPVKYYKWRKERSFDREDSTLEEVLGACAVEDLDARPVSEPTSFWVVTRGGDLADDTQRPSMFFEVRRGVETNLEGAYRVIITGHLPEGCALVRNVRRRIKRHVPEVTAKVEYDLLYPYASGESVRRWRCDPAGLYLIPHTRSSGMKPLPLETMQRSYPLSFRYLKFFEEILKTRPLHLRWGRRNEFYAVYDIGPYTFAPWKVVWKRSTNKFEACVISEAEIAPGRRNLIIPNGGLMMVPFVQPEPAHYLCAVLNSSVARWTINASISRQAHRNIIDVIAIAPFNASDDVHCKLAMLSERAHCAAASEDSQAISAVEEEIDGICAEMWGIPTEDLQRYRDYLPDSVQSVHACTHNGDVTRRDNESAVVVALEESGEMTAAEVAAATGMDAAELRTLLRQMIEKGRVERVGRGRGTRYRLIKGGET